ncbi:transcription antitermination factor NusG [Breznakibacter xylanolyticus]|uniref:Transcription antitermination factor NusG n=1 Tax=Breznakibacter xylanolyticus TaxID=990 RepID=A0A2W7N338_9BACT|nr:UpxY family transcription antiterminator [Breznakibacter xylanolyticus]MBN2743577.1 UpxY family transcription antiterminator [Marinilabiliaceae bacterium]PZX12767.1 transcription antitermination factor NusG [Breznakibacter xylanolyticus]
MKNEGEKEASQNWYALYTRSRAEKKVHDQFEQRGIHAYLPLRKELRQWSDRKKWVEVPAINSYIFVQLPPDGLKKAYDITGVVAFVNDKGKPAVIPAQQIAAMRATIENNLAFTIEQATLRKGERVHITSGPLTGYEGEITEIRGKSLFCIEISPIGFTLVIDTENATFEKIK